MDAKGKGRVNIFGRLGIKEIRAHQTKFAFFIYDSASIKPCIYVYDDAHVGITGSAGTFYAYTTRNGKIDGGQFACADNLCRSIGLFTYE